MYGPLLILLLVILIVLLVSSWSPSPTPGAPSMVESLWAAFRRSLGDEESHWPRSREYITGNIPRSWPIRSVLVMANEELQAMHQTLASAKAVNVPDHIIRSYDENMKQAGRLLNRNSDRIVQAARTGPVSPQLEEALNRKQQSLQRLLDALQTARGSLAAVIVTGLEDQRDLDRLARSLQAWSEALGDVSVDTLTAGLPSSVHEA